MRVAVLGGGLQGCCAALALADRGAEVTLFDRNSLLLSRAAVANEGKIHLGYMYAADPTLATARMMMRGALAFSPFLERHLGQGLAALSRSQPATYLVHRESLYSPDSIAAYLARVHDLVREAAQESGDYFGLSLSTALRAWSTPERESEFDPAVHSAFDTPEVAIQPVVLAEALRACIGANPHIEVRLEHTVMAVEDRSPMLSVVSNGKGGTDRSAFEHVINALWEGRIAVDATRGLLPPRPWLHRLKYGVSFRVPRPEKMRSATVVSGPFGEIVNYGDGLLYLTWYPECMQGMSREVTPPAWQTVPDALMQEQIFSGTVRALSTIAPALGDIDRHAMSDINVRGGVIVAWGKSDIDDPESELHRRFDIGITSAGSYHSIDPGKLTMAPYFAEACAERIMPN